MKAGFVLALALVASGTLAAQTGAQIDAGRGSYQARCAGCHGADLAGGEAPQLAGTNFRASWGTRSARELVSYIQASMPPSLAGTLSAAEVANVSGFILAANGAAAGNQPLGADSMFTIRSVATGRPTISLQGAGGAAAPASGPRGLSVTGEVKN